MAVLARSQLDRSASASLIPTYFHPQIAVPDSTCAVTCEWTTQLCSIDKSTCVCRFPLFPATGGTSTTLSCSVGTDIGLNASTGCVSSPSVSASLWCPGTRGLVLASSAAAAATAASTGLYSLCNWGLPPLLQCSINADQACYQYTDTDACRLATGCEKISGWYSRNMLCQPLDPVSTVAVPHNPAYSSLCAPGICYVSPGLSAWQDDVQQCYVGQGTLAARQALALANPISLTVQTVTAVCDVVANATSLRSAGYALYRVNANMYYFAGEVDMWNYVLTPQTTSYARCINPQLYPVAQAWYNGYPISYSCYACTKTCHWTTEVCSTDGQSCACQDDSVYNSTLGYCQKIACVETNTYGYDCTQTCSGTPPQGGICNAGPLGDGSFTCTPPYVMNPTGSQCTLNHCNQTTVLGVGLQVCNGHGICGGAGLDSSGAVYGVYQTCYCDIGYSGLYCQNGPGSDAATQVCDCGVIWSSPTALSAGSTLQGSIALDLPPVQLLQLYNAAGNVVSTKSVSSPLQLLRPVGSLSAARWICYQSLQCSGVVTFMGFALSPREGLPASTLYVLFISTLAATSSNTTVLLSTQLGFNTYQLSTIDRFSLYNCPLSSDGNPPFDSAYYNRLYSAYINDLKQQYSSVTQTIYQSQWPLIHWTYVGHQLRLQPNSVCFLTPVLWTSASLCTAPVCPVVGLPCSGNGYCQLNAVTGVGECSCRTFASIDYSVQGLGNVAAWAGVACQYTTLICINPGDIVLCSGYQRACKPRAIWTPSIPLLSINQSSYVPQCDCSGEPATGQYCQQSRCGDDGLGSAGNGCNNAGVCVFNATNQTYSCICPAGLAGANCQIDVSACVNTALHPPLTCSGQGTCTLNTTLGEYQCSSCFGNATGKFCQNSQCAPSLMTPGHGNCINGVLTGCFAVYSGASCQIDQCSLYGGIVTNGGAACDCEASHVGLNNTMTLWDSESGFNTTGDLAPREYTNSSWQPYLNGALVATCWPQCPVSTQTTLFVPSGPGIMCNHPNATCLQSQSNQNNANSGLANTRTAVCVCPLGYITSDTSTPPGLCVPWCSNGGTIDSAWTAQRPTPCLCPNSGYVSGSALAPHCNVPVCTVGQGVFNVQLSACSCFPPYTGVACNQTTCGVTGTVVPWRSDDATSPWRCSCAAPTATPSALAPFNCTANSCGLNGVFRPQSLSCVCLGLWRTLNTSLLPCTDTYCLNGGVPNVTDASLSCICAPPYVNGPLGLCEAVACSNATTVGVDLADGCMCSAGFAGPDCDLPIAIDGAIDYTPTEEAATTSGGGGGASVDPAIIGGAVAGGLVVLVFAVLLVEWQLQQMGLRDKAFRRMKIRASVDKQ